MREIKVDEENLQKYATLFGKIDNKAYTPLRNGNMSYTRANSINEFRNNLVDLVLAVEKIQQAVSQDALRVKQMGTAFAKQDRALGQEIGQMEVR
ncbi:DUF3130 domain-containing protein [Listeria booriae]|uniref:Type VII secretion protein n=1 Tax=Listeria booriae TaxID=1552123 RepID=A0A099WDU1_9LIST|nr:DUF3130 family protein [Listeria booriae]KGL42688.1 hypothetical protein EP57_04305 [Listeria booriae]STY40923.1 type VII secretion effector [Listeria booriae]